MIIFNKNGDFDDKKLSHKDKRNNQERSKGSETRRALAPCKNFSEHLCFSLYILQIQWYWA